MRILAFLFATMVALSPVAHAAVPDIRILDKAELTVWSATGANHRFDVEVAKTSEEQTRGLMYRKSLDADSGMIFMNRQDQTMTFWMKNCYIPLDMLFVAADGRINRIKENARPLFESAPGPDDYIPSGGPVRAVVELNGGTAEKLGIQVGDRVVFPGLGK